MNPERRKRPIRAANAKTLSKVHNCLHSTTEVGQSWRVSDARARARSIDRVLRAGANGEVEVTSDLLRSLARVADRVAVDLARVERDMAVAA